MLEPASGGCLPGGCLLCGVSALGGLLWGVSAPRGCLLQGGLLWGVLAPRGCLLWGGVCSQRVCSHGGLLQGVSALGGVCSGEVSAPRGSTPMGGVCSRGVVSQHALRQTPSLWTESQMPVKHYLGYNFIVASNYNGTYFELASEEATHCDHCHLICCVYIKGHVEMVDTKDQSNAIVYCVCYVVCQHCQHEDQSMLCIECYVC